MGPAKNGVRMVTARNRNKHVIVHPLSGSNRKHRRFDLYCTPGAAARFHCVRGLNLKATETTGLNRVEWLL
uniref:Uncharacterized protein n=1 Tax=Anopheles minimus TaxID=112268 RepID=A0A182WNY5_9DIPT